MPKSTDFLRSFTCHGVDIATESGGHGIGTCPFCGKEGKFYVNISTGQYDCKSCSDAGNLVIFMRKFWDMLSSSVHPYEEIAKRRKILAKETIASWGLVLSPTGNWLAPGYNSGREIVQLYRYFKGKDKEKYRFWLTPKSNHGIHIYQHGDADSDTVYITEGLWDGAVLSEILPKGSMILAVPGCNIFLSNWCSYLAGRDVIFLYDNDHPTKVKVGDGYHPVPPPALVGLKTAIETLTSFSHTPASISYLKWGDEEDYYSTSLPHGYDLSDALCQGRTLRERRKLWESLSQKIEAVPKEWLVKKSITAINLKPSKCTEWKELVTHWRRAMAWPEPGESLDYGMSIILACILSTSTQGEQVWIKLIGPPSCGKSVLAEACTVSKKYVKALSVLRSLYSGYRTSKDDEEDNSLVPLLLNKTLIIKDGDTLVKSPNAEKILSELRDLYDGAGRTHYNNRMGKDYEGVRFTLVICGTEALSVLDRSELGERFVDCVLLETLHETEEEEIGWRVAVRACAEVAITTNGVPESLMTEELIQAKQHTAGYIEHLRNNAERLLSRVGVSEKSLRYCQHLATFASFMRTKQPLDKGKFHPEIKAQRELSFRLISQFVRLARCLAAVLNKKELDESVLRRVRQVSLDTSRGTSLDVCRELYQVGEAGMDTRSLGILLSQEDAKMKSFLRFLRKIGIVESFVPASNYRIQKQAKWKLTGRIRRLYEVVVLEEAIERNSNAKG